MAAKTNKLVPRTVALVMTELAKKYPVVTLTDPRQSND